MAAQLPPVHGVEPAAVRDGAQQSMFSPSGDDTDAQALYEAACALAAATPAPLHEWRSAPNTEGVYGLLLDGRLVYVGAALTQDAGSGEHKGLRARVGKYLPKIRKCIDYCHSKPLTPDRVRFVCTPVGDGALALRLEKKLQRAYRPLWYELAGIGSNSTDDERAATQWGRRYWPDYHQSPAPLELACGTCEPITAQVAKMPIETWREVLAARPQNEEELAVVFAETAARLTASTPLVVQG